MKNTALPQNNTANHIFVVDSLDGSSDMQWQVLRVKQSPSFLDLQGRAGDSTAGCQCCPAGVAASAMHSTGLPVWLLGHHVLWERLQAGVRLPELGTRDLQGEL